MRAVVSLRSVPALVFVLAAMVVAPQVSAQSFATMVPAGDAMEDPAMPGAWAVPENGIVRWRVIFDGTGAPLPATVRFIEDLMPGGCIDPARGPTMCLNIEQQELLCSGPDAPDPGSGVVIDCNEGTDFLDIDMISVPGGGLECIEFSTQVTAPAGTQIFT